MPPGYSTIRANSQPVFCWVGKNYVELIVGLFWSYEEDGKMKVRFHLESVTLGDGLVDLVGLRTMFGLAVIEGDVFVKAVRVMASTGIFVHT